MASDEIPYPYISIHSDLQDLSSDSDTESQRIRNSDSISARSRSSTASTTTTTIQDTDSVTEVSSTSKGSRSNDQWQPEIAGKGTCSRESGETPGGRSVKEDCEHEDKCEHGTRLNDYGSCKEKVMDKEAKDKLPKSTQQGADNVIVGVDDTGQAVVIKKGDHVLTTGTTNPELGHSDKQTRNIQDVSAGCNLKEVVHKMTGGDQGQVRPEQPGTATNRTPQSSISQDTGSWATSHSSSAVFQDTPKKFYIFNPEWEDFKSPMTGPSLNDVTTGTQEVSRGWRELLGMVETCFHKKITPDYILLILYARRKYDPTAKKFFKNVPEDILNRLYCEVDTPCSACAGC